MHEFIGGIFTEFEHLIRTDKDRMDRAVTSNPSAAAPLALS